MAFSRRTFLQQLTAGASGAALLQVPLAGKLFASPEPQRSPIVSGAILLNSNENAYGPLPSAMRAMQASLLKGNRYPFSRYEPLAESVARHHGVKMTQVVMGA